VDISFVANDNRVQIGSSLSINMPSNTEVIDNASSNNLHFNAEISEYTLTTASETLFKRFYENYIVNVFDSKNRLTKVTAVLPVNKIIDIEMYDVIIVGGRKYRINTMKTNLKDGRTEFELINYYD
jgi:3'-phosphoadenosine 5'-phosphosulfate sulfotransferase (PAPS reductase)/FAD synthetase